MSSPNEFESEIDPPSPDEPRKDEDNDEILAQLRDFNLDGEEQEKFYDAGMAKLHALLTKKVSSITTTQLKRAAFRAEKSIKYYRRATQFFNQPDMKNIFPFFALPVELRLAIYHELLVTDDRLILNWRGPKKVKNFQKKMHIAIMQTCQLCAKEGAGVLYGENVFDFEDVKQRMNIGKPVVKRIGIENAALIRSVICEYGASSEELSFLDAGKAQTHRLTVSWLASFFRDYGINLDQLRVLAISIAPFGRDATTEDIVRMQHPVLLTKGFQAASEFKNWVDNKNKGLDKVVDGICERERQLKKVDYEKDVARRIGFDMSAPVWGRQWIAYTK